MAASDPVSLGENSRITIGAAILNVIEGTLTEDPEERPTTCNESGGFNTRTRGPRNCTLDCRVQWRPLDNPKSLPPELEPGSDTAEAVTVYPDFENDPTAFWALPVAYVANNSVRIDGTGVQEYNFQLKNQGAYYSPSRVA